ncbi:MAG: DUF924 family protein [Pseudohongiellaceae bacterium]|nr:DUF924 family protein [Pseudohongiellaceae bacterium]
MYQEVLKFWFEECKPDQWWKEDPEFDALVKKRFSKVMKAAQASELSQWRKSAEGRLAEIIVLDQFSRNIYRNTPQAFAQDPMALALSQEAVMAGAPLSLDKIRCCFLLMPFMHSESRVVHTQAERLFKKFAPEENYAFELKHKAIVDWFERYPHRNKILGRESTEEEIAFLQQPNSGF